MRWLFILLLLVNVVYLGWELDRETRIQVRKSQAQAMPASAQRLRLISEMENPPPARGTAGEGGGMEMEFTTTNALVAELPDILVTGADVMLSNHSCFRFGPVPAEEMAKGLYDWFRSRNADARVRYTEEPSARMYWIYLAPQQSRETALAVLEEMKSKGIGDYRLIGRGDLENAISLGLYSSRAAVDTRLKELGEKGYVPVVVPYSNVNRMYWLDVRVPAASAALAGMYDDYPAKYESVPVDCGDISVFDPRL